MNMRHTRVSAALLPLAIAALLGISQTSLAQPQSPLVSAFTYQGELASAGISSSGLHDFRFRLYSGPVGGTPLLPPYCSDNVNVADGRFATVLDFGPAMFAGQKRYLEIEVRQDTGLNCSNASGYTVLSPRQELTATPNATFALTAASASSAGNAQTLGGQPGSFFTNATNLTGTLPSATLPSTVARTDANQTFTGLMNFSNAGNLFSGAFSGSGAGLTNLSGQSITAGSVPRTSLGNASRLGMGTFLGDWSRTPYVALDNVMLDAPGSAIASSGSIACVATASSLRVFDISDLTIPRLLGATATTSGATAMTISGTRVYVVTNSRTLQVFDISVPSVPVLTGSVDTGFIPNGISVSGSLACVTVNDSFDGKLQVYDISVPTAPTRLTSVGTGGLAKSVAVVGSFAYVINEVSNTLQVYNISNPVSPAVVGSTSTRRPGQNIVVVGQFAYITETGDGQIGSNSLRIYNISVPTAPVFIGSVATGTVPTGLAVSGPYAFVTGFSTGLQVFQVTNPAAPNLIGAIPTSGDSAGVAVSEGSAFVIPLGSNTLRVLSGGISGLSFSGPIASAVSPSALSGVDGSGLVGLNAANLTTGTLANARTSGTNLNTPNALVLRDASGNFSAGTITAALSGNATTATNAATATNATLLSGQPASFYTSATTITTGTLDAARLPATAARTDLANVFSSTGNTTFAGNLGIAGAAATSPLRVRGDAGFEHLRIDPGASTIGSFISLNATPIAGGNQYLLFSSGGTAGEGQGKFAIKNQTTQTFGFVMTSNGNVGIGTLDPTSRLTVAGNMNVTGSLAKAGGSFLIDHPLDPENKYLYHSFVESPDMMNIYNGNVTTDGNGYATITMPDYFEALNRDFRYQLTVIDESDDMDVFLWAKVVREVKGNSFTLRSSRGNLKVSWQVTGIRQDAWANKNRIPNAVVKTAADKGKLLHPEAFGQPENMGIYQQASEQPNAAIAPTNSSPAK